MKVMFGFLCRYADLSADKQYLHAMDIGVGGYNIGNEIKILPQTSLVVKFCHNEVEIGKEIKYEVEFCSPKDEVIIKFPSFKITPAPPKHDGDISTSTVLVGFVSHPVATEGIHYFKVICDGAEVHRENLGVRLIKAEKGSTI